MTLTRILILGCLSLGAPLARAAEYLTPADVPMAPESAAQETVSQTASETALRLGPFDFFPHAAVTALYDDNVLITHTQPISDLEWTLAPGFTVLAGDLASSLPASVTMEQVRGYLDYTLSQDTAMATRYLGFDYTPGINLFTDHGNLDNVDHLARLSAGYGFGHLALGLDQDFSRVDVKEPGIGTRLTVGQYKTDIRCRYEVNDRSSFDIEGRYYRLEYPGTSYEGYDEFRNEDWYNRRVGAKLELGVGGAFGLVYPDVTPSQTYEQALARAVYNVSSKLDLRGQAGYEFRQYSHGEGSSSYPVFRLAAIYYPRATTVLTLEGRREDQPAFFANVNYSTIGFTLGLRQTIHGPLSATVTAGYEHVDYKSLSGPSYTRTDDYLNARASLDYMLNPRWTATLYYTRNQDDSSFELYTFSNNLVGAQVTWRF
jgi:hypothetical protein